MISLKVAAWALAIFVLSLFGLIMINLFGNITVTNQFNYTAMKNTVEAAMYDALDIAHYRAGFCMCTDREKTGGKWVFNDDKEYELSDIVYNNGTETCSSSKKNCEILHGEYRMDPQVFSESLIRRFAEVVNNNKDYEIIIQDVIEYPPKASVRVNSKDTEFSPTDSSNGYTIVNQMDSIIETWSGLPTPTATPEPTATPTPNAPNDPDPTANTGSSGYYSNTNNCKWHARMVTAFYTEYVNGVERSLAKGVPCYQNTGSIYSSQSEAKNAKYNEYLEYAKNRCTIADHTETGGQRRTFTYTFKGISMDGYQYYYVYKKGTYTKKCSNKIAATSPSGALINCGGCPASECVAICTN